MFNRNNGNRGDVPVKDRNSVQYYGEVPMFSWIDLNPVELCNRTCFFCPRGHDYPNTNDHMDISTSSKLADELERVGYDGSINICGNGEPLLHYDITGLIESLDGFYVMIVTNGDRLDKNAVYNLYESGLDHINVSLYDGEEQVGKFTELFDSMDVGGDRYTLRHYYRSDDLDYGMTGLNNRAGFIDFGDPEPDDNPCYYMHYSIMVDWNGDVLWCLQDVYGKVSTFGNVNEDSIMDIWTSDKMNNARKLLYKTRSKFTPCKDCNVEGTRYGENHVKEWVRGYEQFANQSISNGT